MKSIILTEDTVTITEHVNGEIPGTYHSAYVESECGDLFFARFTERQIAEAIHRGRVWPENKKD